jgi:hypothetical protein
VNYNTPERTNMKDDEIGNNDSNAASDSHPN